MLRTLLISLATSTLVVSGCATLNDTGLELMQAAPNARQAVEVTAGSVLVYYSGKWVIKQLRHPIRKEQPCLLSESKYFRTVRHLPLCDQ